MLLWSLHVLIKSSFTLYTPVPVTQEPSVQGMIAPWGHTDTWSQENIDEGFEVEVWELERRLLTDVVVFVAWAKLKAQREGCEELELLWEFKGPVWTHWAVAFPALEAFHVVVAGGVAIIVDHKKDVTFHALLRKMVLVVRTVDVQVVIDGHLHCVFTMQESAKKKKNLLEIHKIAKDLTMTGRRFRMQHLSNTKLFYQTKT